MAERLRVTYTFEAYLTLYVNLTFFYVIGHTPPLKYRSRRRPRRGLLI